MAALSIRDLDDTVKEKLRVRAAEHGRSMEAEVRAILAEAVDEPERSSGLFTALTDRFADLGGIDLAFPARDTSVRSADLTE
jgi:plasmid stability protein